MLEWHNSKQELQLLMLNDKLSKFHSNDVLVLLVLSIYNTFLVLPMHRLKNKLTAVCAALVASNEAGIVGVRFCTGADNTVGCI